MSRGWRFTNWVVRGLEALASPLGPRSCAEAAWSAFRREIASKYPVSEGQAFPLSRVQKALPVGAALVGWIDVAAGGGAFDSWVYAVRSQGPVAWARCGSETPGRYSPFRESQNYREQLATPQSSGIGVSRDARRLWAAAGETGPVMAQEEFLLRWLMCSVSLIALGALLLHLGI